MGMLCCQLLTCTLSPHLSHPFALGSWLLFLLSVLPVSMKEAVAPFNLEAPLHLRTHLQPWVAMRAGRRGHGIRPCHSLPSQTLTPKTRQRLAGEAARRHVPSSCSKAAQPPRRNSRTPDRTAVLLSLSAFWSSCERSLSVHHYRGRHGGSRTESPHQNEL